MKAPRPIIIAALLIVGLAFHAENVAADDQFQPTRTVKFASKDGQDLFFDIYEPTPGSKTTLDGKEKPTLVYIFGGAFMAGQRNDISFTPWFKEMNDRGYRVVSIDYRLAMKGVKYKNIIEMAKVFRHALEVATEDLFSAVRYMVDNEEDLGIDPGNLVVTGTSAGALTSLFADYLVANDSATVELPEGFRFAGVMPFSGAIVFLDGPPKYPKEPAPTMFVHGTKDNIVNYKSMNIFGKGVYGSHKLAKMFRKQGFNYNIFRYEGNYHEIAIAMMYCIPEQVEFLEKNVMRGERRIVDATIIDPSIRKMPEMSL